MLYRLTAAVWVLCVTSVAPLPAATLEKLSIEQMTQKATLIVRGRVSTCSGEAQGSMIYTRCQVQVIESWKGSAPALVSFSVPGGTYQGLVQTFTGTPRINVSQEYVLFLWTGKSGRTQVIGLSQGVFDIVTGTSSSSSVAPTPHVLRAASGERMLDNSGRAVRDSAIDMSVTELRDRVKGALTPSGSATE